MPSKTSSTRKTESNESSEGQSWAPAVVLVATVALCYSFLVGTVVGHVI